MNQAPTMRVLLDEVYQELTNLDSRVWQTIRALIRPGLLAQRWTRGQYAGLLPPFRLYIIASTLFFFAGGGIWISWGLTDDLLDLMPDFLFHDLNADPIRRAIEVRMMGWVALIRMASLIPLALLVALMLPRGQPRMAPAFVFSMNFFTLTFLLAISLAIPGWLISGFLVEVERGWLTVSALAIERILLLVWLVLGLHRFLERGWLFSALSALFLILVDLALLLLAFASGFAIVAETIVGQGNW